MDQRGRLESTATGLGAAALMYVIETGQQADLELFLTVRSGEPVQYEDPENASWDKVLNCSARACAHISRMFAAAAQRRPA